MEKEPKIVFSEDVFQLKSLLALNNVAIMDFFLVPDPMWMPKSKADIPDWQKQRENLAMENMQ